MTTALLSLGSAKSAGQQLYEWFVVHGRTSQGWPPWAQLSPIQQAIFTRWADLLFQTAQEDRHA
jgi:hypothetical protein